VSSHDDLPFVVPSDGAVILDPESVDDWADALVVLYKDGAELSRMAAAAARFTRERHSVAANTEAREAIYRRVL
jgi:glycosyltransferase involved in cell wall biosynthesis